MIALLSSSSLPPPALSPGGELRTELAFLISLSSLFLSVVEMLLLQQTTAEKMADAKTVSKKVLRSAPYTPKLSLHHLTYIQSLRSPVFIQREASALLVRKILMYYLCKTVFVLLMKTVFHPSSGNVK